MSTQNKLSHSMISLHWLIAILMIGSIAFGIYIEELPRTDSKFEYIQLHKSIGVIVLLLAVLRIVNTAKNGFPAPLGTPKPIQVKLAHFTHGLLLAGTIFMPVSGVMMSVGGGHSVAVFGLQLIASGDEKAWLSTLGHTVHGIGGKLMIAAILLHIAGTVKHSLMDKDGTLKRMIGKNV